MKRIISIKSIKKIIQYSLLAIITTITLSVIITNISPRPLSFLAKRFIFDPKNTHQPSPVLDISNTHVFKTSDLNYPSISGRNQFDIYRPDRNDDYLPVMIWIHGGGFVGGDKAMVADFASLIANEGYAVITMNYALAPHNTYPSPVYQTEELVRHLYTLKDQYKLDMNRLAFAGDSAGAQIASQYVITQTDPDYAKLVGVESLIPTDTIKATLLYSGPYRIEDLTQYSHPVVKFVFNQLGWAYIGERNWHSSPILKEASIIDNVNSNFPPTYITDGNTTSFETSARHLEEKLNNLNITTQTRFFDTNESSTMHEYQFKLQTEEAQLALQDTLSFLETYLR